MTWDRPSNKSVSLSGELMTAGMFSLRDHCSQRKAIVEDYRFDFHSQNINILWNHPICGGSMSVDFVGYLTHKCMSI